MSRREMERRKYREALVPALLVSAVAHALILGVGFFGVSLPGSEDDRAAEERAERWEENSIEVVSVRPRSSSAAGERAAEAAPSRTSVQVREAAVAGDGVRAPSASGSVSTERVATPAVAVALPSERKERERLSASDLAAMFPGDDQMPEATSRAARQASGEHRDVGDRFQALGGTQRAGPAGGGCTSSPGSIVDRRFPSNIGVGGS